MRRAGLLALVLLGGCPKPRTEPPPALVESTTIAPVPTGRITDGTYVDGTFPLSAPVPPGWAATPGTDGGAVRVVLQDPEGDVTVTIAGVRGDTLVPRPIPGCTWTFTDAARYRAVKVVGEILAATCTPDDAGEPRILAYVVLHEGMLWHVEGRIPPGKLRAGKVDLDVIAGGVRFR